MSIKSIYQDLEEIPEPFRELFTERGGQWELTGIEGIKTQADVDRVTEATRKLRAEVKDLKHKLDAFGSHDPEAIAKAFDELEDLRVSATADPAKAEAFEAALTERVQTRLKRELGPVQRDLDKLRKESAETAAERDALRTDIRRSRIHSAIRDAVGRAKGIRPNVVGDILLVSDSLFELADDGAIVTRDGAQGVTPGLSPDEWLKDQRRTRDFWWMESVGGGANGAGAGGRGSATDLSKLTPRQLLEQTFRGDRSGAS